MSHVLRCFVQHRVMDALQKNSKDMKFRGPVGQRVEDNTTATRVRCQQ